MPRTLTAPPTNRRYWKRLLRRVHPDGGGDDDLFIWVSALHDHVAGNAIEPLPRHARRPPPQHHTSGERVPYEGTYDEVGFAFLTTKALAMADEAELGEPYARLLRLLTDCSATSEADTVLYRQQNEGAAYRSLAAIAHKAGMSKAQRVRWYGVCESVPFSQRPAGHICIPLS
jgi:hypothetical protein